MQKTQFITPLSGVMTNGTSKTAKIKKMVITLLQHIAKMSTAAEVSPFQHLAERTNGRPYATVFRLSVIVCRLSVTYVLWLNGASQSKGYTLTAYRKSYMRNRLVPKLMTLTFVYRSNQGHVNHCVAYNVHYLRNRQRQRLGSKGPPIGNGI